MEGIKINIEYRLLQTGKMSDREIEDFLKVFNEAFNMEYSKAWFSWKYLDNIYGDSFIVIAYVGDEPIGIRSFWRNDLGGTLSYQPCDTAVSSNYRKLGVFSKMTLVLLDRLGGHLIYNFPNENSFPGNIKLGWKLKSFLYLKLVGARRKLKEETFFMEDDYLKWRYINSPINKYFYYENKGDYYLLFKRKANFYYVLGRFNGEFADEFTRASFPILFNYTSEETLMYRVFKNKTRLVTYDVDARYKDIEIPIHKGDFF